MKNKININNLKIARDGLLWIDPEIARDPGVPTELALRLFPYMKGIGSTKKDLLYGRIHFGEYSERIFGFGPKDTLFHYMFDRRYIVNDDTMEGLIQRMTDVIEGLRVFELKDQEWVSWEDTNDDNENEEKFYQKQSEDNDKLSYHLRALDITD